MNIGIMLRHYGQHQGGVFYYTRQVLRHMFSMRTRHRFTLIYNDPSFLGTFANYDGVQEIVAHSRSKLVWDQLVVPRLVKKYGIDLIFNPKYSLPLAVRCPTVFVCHGLDWYVEPRWSAMIDRVSHKYLVPFYANKATRIIAVSKTTKEHVVQYLHVDESRVDAIYSGVSERFATPVPEAELQAVRERFKLPPRFLLYVGRIYPPKNFGGLIRAYAKVGPELGIPLVVAGQHSEGCEHEIALIDKLRLGDWVRQIGWVDLQTLCSLYRLTEALVMPSLYESFGFPVLEAMTAGCPVVTTNRHGPLELAGDAAAFVEPENIDSIADGMRRVVTDTALRAALIEKGFARASEFTWQQCALETVAALEHAYAMKTEHAVAHA